MSGGSLDYFYGRLEEHVGDFKDAELDELVKDLADLFYAREWFLSGDTSEGDWREKRDAFKKKWFTIDGRESRFRKYLDDFRAEMLESMGLDSRYCKDCVNFTAEEESRYGDCKLAEGYLVHRSDQCEKFERKEK